MGSAITGAIFPPGDWYKALNKPPWTPPDWVFPLTWTVLYACMALAATRVAGMPGSEYAIALWAVQATFNGLWSPVFFGLQRIRGGMIVVSILWIAVAASMVALWQVDWIAGVLFAPYLLWVTIAATLNLSVLLRNPAEAAA